MNKRAKKPPRSVTPPKPAPKAEASSGNVIPKEPKTEPETETYFVTEDRDKTKASQVSPGNFYKLLQLLFAQLLQLLLPVGRIGGLGNSYKFPHLSSASGRTPHLK